MSSSPSPPAAPARKGHRQALLEAAKSLLREKGYGHITARDLVAASDTNLGSIGYHFGSKEGLLNEAVGLALEEWAEAIANAGRADPDASPVERMAASSRAMLDEFEQIRPYYLAFLEALAHSTRSPQLAEQLAVHYDRQRSRVATLILDTFGPSLDEDAASHLATFVIALSDGLILQSFVDPERMPTSIELMGAAGEALATLRRATEAKS